MSLPLHGQGADSPRPEPTHFPPEPAEAVAALEAAASAAGDERDRLLRQAVATWPTLLDGWARLAQEALARNEVVEAYAYARVGYHRGLDRARQAGWRGAGPVPGDHPPNQGFVRSVWMLGRAAAGIGESDEAQRCQDLLADLDPQNGLGVA
ncbi:MAG: DUF3151 domain-containing protein [Actinobacteria bacterium QS_5_72_10]|nr:MAG: DUF3151 domain-containing protein [Actinobacteria bacterium QS_5_72_10]